MTPPRGSRWLRPLMAWRGLRRRLVFQVRQEHFAELGVRVPIGSGLSCPIADEENLMSFGEIFGEREYDALFAEIPLPRRWLDIGAHCGYFSLHLASRWLREDARDWRALLVEPDPRRAGVIAAGLEQPALEGRLQWIGAAVGAPAPSRTFALRTGMISSLDGAADRSLASVQVPVAGAEALMAALPGPYDLLKLDIEGGEYDFVKHYGALCSACRAIVVEWHAPTPDAACVAELRATLAGYGLTRVQSLRPLHTAGTPGPLAVTGLELFRPARPL